MKGISFEDHSNCWIIEERISHWGKVIDKKKLFLLYSMLNEFCEGDCTPYLVKYLDYRIMQFKKYMIVETAFRDEGIQLKDLTKFELAILFKDMRTHFKNMILTLAYLKVRLVLSSQWLINQNIMFNLETLTVKFCGYIVVDVLKTSEEQNKKMNLKKKQKNYSKATPKTTSTNGKKN